MKLNVMLGTRGVESRLGSNSELGNRTRADLTPILTPKGDSLERHGFSSAKGGAGL